MCVVGVLSGKARSKNERLQELLGPQKNTFSNFQVHELNKNLSICSIWNNSKDKPIKKENEKYIAVAEGEIYNKKEIRDKLYPRDTEISSMNSSESIIDLYYKYGSDSIKLIDGGFCLFLWDKKRKELSLFNSEDNSRPIYYTKQGDLFHFATEIKSVLNLSFLDKSINKKSLSHYLVFTHVLPPLTLINGIYKLIPGGKIKVHGSKIKELKTWKSSNSAHNKVKSIKKAEELLKSSIRKRQSEENSGVLLSGGFDSSLLVSLLSDITDNDISTYTAVYGYPSLDEDNYAGEISSLFGTEHQEIKITPQKVLETSPRALWHQDELFPDLALSMRYILPKAAKKGQNLFLGEGADSIMGSGGRHEIARKSSHLRNHVPPELRKILYEFLREQKFPYRIKKGLKICSSPYFPDFYTNLFDFFDRDLIQSKLHTSEDINSKLRRLEPKRVGGKDWLKRFSETHFHLFTTERIREDKKFSFYRSQKSFHPYLDSKFRAFLKNIPLSSPLRRKKLLLKKVGAGKAPKNIIKRKKRPLPVLLAKKWFKENEKEVMKKIKELDSRDIFKGLDLSKLVSESSIYTYRKIWRLFFLEIWLQLFLDREKIPFPEESSKIINF